MYRTTPFCIQPKYQGRSVLHFFRVGFFLKVYLIQACSPTSGLRSHWLFTTGWLTTSLCVCVCITWLRVAEYSGLTGKKGTALLSVTSVLWFWVVNHTVSITEKQSISRKKNVAQYWKQGHLITHSQNPHTQSYTEAAWLKEICFKMMK